MNIVYKKLGEISPYEKNPRKNDKAVQYVAESIKEFGFKVPIVVDADGIIVAGHTRYKAAKKLKLKEVPVIIADDLTEEQVKAYRLADNKVAEQAEWDMDLLTDELDGIFDIDMELFGFDFLEEEEPEAVEDEYEVTVPEEPRAKLGDIYQLGEHRLMCGDSTSIDAVSELMGVYKADMVFTDPPYGVDYEGINNDSRSTLEDLLDKAFANMKAHSKKGASVYCFHSDRCADIFHKIFRRYCHFSSMIVWKKQSLVLSQTDYQSIHEPCMYGWFNNGTHEFYGNRKQTSVWEYVRETISGHTTPKPVSLICNALKNSSRMDDIVLDLFGGSGSTLIACHQAGRRCFMMELDPKYIDVIIDRWETFTGEKAVLLNPEP